MFGSFESLNEDSLFMHEQWREEGTAGEKQNSVQAHCKAT